MRGGRYPERSGKKGTVDIRWLEDLLTLAETRSFVHAAQRRNVTQSGLSRRIQALERWASVRLVDRAAAPVALTPEGKSLAEVAAEVIRRLDQQRQLFAAARFDKRELRVAAPGLLAHRLFERWLRGVREGMGGFALTLFAEHLPQCCAALNEGKIDILLCMLDRDGAIERRLLPHFKAQPGFAKVIGRETLIPLAAVSGRDARPATTGARAALDLLAYDPACTLGWAVEQALARRPEIEVRSRQHGSSVEGLRAMAVAGLGVAWLPESATTHERQTGRLVRATDPSLDIPLDVVAIRPRYKLSPIAQAAWCLLSETPDAAPAEMWRIAGTPVPFPPSPGAPMPLPHSLAKSSLAGDEERG